ncbi:hypothetical protein [uncultured Paraglaciecola sp.]|uniref:hypothetical protein n=1 Tax=uncultured Paraglaciecola sp. TaxID=1765024 RepID=UPI00260C8E1D|nr:hypothetical protein [uncultured Paraglaciecola sp.]
MNYASKVCQKSSYRKSTIDIEKIEKQLAEAEIKLKETYAMGAHLMPTCRSPHPEQEAQIKADFLQKWHTGQTLIDGDYACIDLKR